MIGDQAQGGGWSSIQGELETSTILEQELRRVVVTNNGIFKSII